MHRTEAVGSVSGAYVDKDLPLVPGTVLAASDRNAVQEEIANLVEATGATIQDASTETGDQLKTNFAAPTTAFLGLKALTSGEASITNDGVLLSIKADATDTKITAFKSSSGEASAIDETGVEAYNTTGSARHSKLIADGVYFEPATGQFTIGGIREAVYELGSSPVWTVDAATNRIYTMATTLTLTGVPDTAEILSVTWAHTYIYMRSFPLACSYESNASIRRIVSASALTDGTSPESGSDWRLYVRYMIP